MKQVFESRLVECQQLGLVDFKRECLHNISVNAVDGFAEKVGLLFFAEPSQAADCRQWFNECATLLRECSRAQGKELLIAIQYIWSHDIFSPGLKQDFTLLALGRIKPNLGQDLCKSLIAAHATDPWVKAHLPKPPEPPKKDDVPSGSEGGGSQAPEAPKTSSTGGSPPDPLNHWYPMGDYAECRLCSFRPPKRWNIVRGAQKTIWRLNPWSRKCETCGYHTIELGLVQDPEPVIPAPGPLLSGADNSSNATSITTDPKADSIAGESSGDGSGKQKVVGDQHCEDNESRNKPTILNKSNGSN